MTTPQQEEQEARARLRHAEKMNRARRHATETAWQRKLREILRELPKGACRCELRCVRTPEALRALAGGCTEPVYVCPRLVVVRRRMATSAREEAA